MFGLRRQGRGLEILAQLVARGTLTRRAQAEGQVGVQLVAHAPRVHWHQGARHWFSGYQKADSSTVYASPSGDHVTSCASSGKIWSEP